MPRVAQPIPKDQISPIFKEYSIDELHRRLGYTLSYLVELFEGRQVASKRFRFTACSILNRPEAELFGDPESEVTDA